ncbi:MAG: hypothetical protein E4H02_06820 [Lentisphaerales bacterium]|jgi:hypothetical protein|nr:MAG: hypothetical protein E4H02_06820 [Lentisphaerales bacterium]
MLCQQLAAEPPIFPFFNTIARLSFRRVTDGKLYAAWHIPVIMSMAVGFASALTSTKQVD